MSSKTIKVAAGAVYDPDTGYYTVDCLAGCDVNREPGELILQARKGRLFEAPGESPIQVCREHSTTRGWGRLDGDSYIVVTDDPDQQWEVNVPVAALDAVAARAKCPLEIVD